MLTDEQKNVIFDYVRRQGSCEPSAVREIGHVDGDYAVYRVDVSKFLDWSVTPPAYWLVCVEPGMNLYRSDRFTEGAGASLTDETLADYTRSFHLGLMLRLMHGAERAFSDRPAGVVVVQARQEH